MSRYTQNYCTVAIISKGIISGFKKLFDLRKRNQKIGDN